MVEAAPV